MLTNFYQNKIIIKEATNQEKMYLRKNAVNISTQGSSLILEDNIFNRVLLSCDFNAILSDICAFNTNFNKNTREYQKLDIAQILNLKFVLNRNKPGYGKTFESIEYCRLKNLKRILIICPKSVVTQWRDQFIRWWPEVEQFISIWGVGPLYLEKVIYITNYEQMLRNQIWQKCKMFSWDIIICDESHRIKSPKAKTTLAIKQLPGQRKLCLTGTPILSRPNDLWSQLNFLSPFLSGKSYWAFTERFCEIEENNWGKKPVGLTLSESAQELLTKVLSIISVGGDNHNVTEGKNIMYVPLEMPVWQRTLYKDIVHLALDNLEECGVTIKNAMDQIIKQQQCTTNPSVLLSGKEINKTLLKDALEHNPKFEWIRDWIEDNEGEKVTIYSRYAKTIKALELYLQKCGIETAVYIGEMSGMARDTSKNKFVQHSARALIGTIGALGTGIDGLQNVCQNVIFLDRDWTSGLNEQAEDRVNRSGQRGMTNVWILQMKHSIDEYVEKIQNKKAEDIKKVFEYVLSHSSS